MYIETTPITMNAKAEPATEPMITGRFVDESFFSLAVVIPRRSKALLTKRTIFHIRMYNI